MKIDLLKAAGAGITGTAVMTAIGLYAAPMMGMPRMNPAELLAGAMGGKLALGWMGHVMIGVVLAVGYAIVAPRLAGPGWVRGATYALAPWLVAQTMLMPMMGMGFFSGSMLLAGGSLVGHLMYGATLGAVYGSPERGRRLAHA